MKVPGGDHNVLWILGHSMWDTFVRILGAFGLRPLYIGYAFGALFTWIVLQTVVNGIRGKTKFTLED